jgi:nucleoid DNA-binding protein
VAGTEGLPEVVSRKTVGLLVDAVFSELRDYFVDAKLTRRATPRFSYPGFGTFTKKRRAGRVVRSPATGAPITIPEAVTVTFQPAQLWKARLNHSRRTTG